jgi:hypothetical protein
MPETVRRTPVGTKGSVCSIEQRDASFDLRSASPPPRTNLLNLPHTTARGAMVTLSRRSAPFARNGAAPECLPRQLCLASHSPQTRLWGVKFRSARPAPRSGSGPETSRTDTVPLTAAAIGRSLVSNTRSSTAQRAKRMRSGRPHAQEPCVTSGPQPSAKTALHFVALKASSPSALGWGGRRPLTRQIFSIQMTIRLACG